MRDANVYSLKRAMPRMVSLVTFFSSSELLYFPAELAPAQLVQPLAALLRRKGRGHRIHADQQESLPAALGVQGSPPRVPRRLHQREDIQAVVPAPDTPGCARDPVKHLFFHGVSEQVGATRRRGAEGSKATAERAGEGPRSSGQLDVPRGREADRRAAIPGMLRA